MRPKIIETFFVITGLVSCTVKADRQIATNLTDSISPGTTFTATITEQIEIDTISRDEFVGYFVEKERSVYDISRDATLISHLDSLRTFWSNKRLWLNDSLKRLDIWGYPKSYRKLKNGVIRVTTCGEGEGGMSITVFTLDTNYNRIDVTTLTSNGGDENVTEKKSGAFTAEAVYKYVDMVYQYDDLGGCDSTSMSNSGCLTFTKSGSIQDKKNCR